MFSQGTEVELTKGWGMDASWDQVWNKSWRTSLYGGFLKVFYNDNARVLIQNATCGTSSLAPN